MSYLPQTEKQTDRQTNRQTQNHFGGGNNLYSFDPLRGILSQYLTLSLIGETLTARSKAKYTLTRSSWLPVTAAPVMGLPMVA